MERCSICDEWKLGKDHRCAPAWEVAIDHGPKCELEWAVIYAHGEQTAVEKFADQYDCYGDYTIIQAGENGETEVFVRRVGKSEIKRYGVVGESVPQYHARLIA